MRFNPNLYDCGKVCLSLLGTWSGAKGETWDPNSSSTLQVPPLHMAIYQHALLLASVLGFSGSVVSVYHWSAEQILIKQGACVASLYYTHLEILCLQHWGFNSPYGLPDKQSMCVFRLTMRNALKAA